MRHFDLTFDYILFAVYCLSFPVYIRVLFITGRVGSNDQKLSPEFFQLVTSTGVADLMAGLQTYLWLRIRMWGLFEGFYEIIDPVWKYVLVLGFLSTFAQSVGTLLIALSRYTSVMHPFKHKNWWSPERTKLLIGLQWGIPALITVPGGFFGMCNTRFMPVPEEGPLLDTYAGNNSGPFASPIVLSFETWSSRNLVVAYVLATTFTWILNSVAVAIIYIKISGKLRQQAKVMAVNKPDQPGGGKGKSKKDIVKEMRMLLYGLSIAVNQATAAVIGIMASNQGLDTWYRMHTIVIDWANMSSPYFLILLSAEVRRRFLTFGKSDGNNRQSSVGGGMKNSRKAQQTVTGTGNYGNNRKVMVAANAGV